MNVFASCEKYHKFCCSPKKSTIERSVGRCARFSTFARPIFFSADGSRHSRRRLCYGLCVSRSFRVLARKLHRVAVSVLRWRPISLTISAIWYTCSQKLNFLFSIILRYSVLELKFILIPFIRMLGERLCKCVQITIKSAQKMSSLKI